MWREKIDKVQESGESINYVDKKSKKKKAAKSKIWREIIDMGDTKG